MMTDPFMPGGKRPKLDFSQELMGGPHHPHPSIGSMMLPMLPLDPDRLSDDEESHRHKNMSGSKLSAEAKRSQHCEVEKRRREKMNRYMSELAQMIPACNAVPRKLDKLSILKMAVDHMKNLRGDPHCSSDYKPGFLTDDELKQLVVEAANGFMMIISCDKACVLFVSDTISDVLHEPAENWIGSTLYDLLHPKDIQKVKEQLASFDVEEALAANSKHNSAKSPLVMHPQSMNGLRRSFLCRVKRGQSIMASPDSTSSSNGTTDCESEKSIISSLPNQYAVLHCTGFIRNLTPAERQSLQVEKDANGACLVAVARLQHFGDSTSSACASSMLPSNDREFIARVGVDGRFSYIDPRVSNILGYLPQDLIGHNSYDYFHPDDMQKMIQLHHEAMKQRTPMPTVHYRFLSKDKKWVWLAMKAFSFVNPFSHQVEYVVCTNVVHTRSTGGEKSEQAQETVTQVDPSKQSSSGPVNRGASGSRGVGGGIKNNELTDLLPDLNWQQTSKSSSSTIPPPLPPPSTSSQPLVDSQSSSVVTQPADTTVQENAVTAQRLVDNYLKMTTPTPHRKDFNYGFPPGLFPAEVDLEGSAQAYHSLIDGLENCSDLQQLLNQVDADPFRSNNIFNELDLDIFD